MENLVESGSKGRQLEDHELMMMNAQKFRESSQKNQDVEISESEYSEISSAQESKEDFHQITDPNAQQKDYNQEDDYSQEEDEEPSSNEQSSNSELSIEEPAPQQFNRPTMGVK
jgi:hypothetical protein